MNQRPWTAERRNPDGTTTITVKRACNSCGRSLGDITDEEIACAVTGEPLPDVAAECGCENPATAEQQSKASTPMSTPGMGARMTHGIPEDSRAGHGSPFGDAYSPIIAEVALELAKATNRFPAMRSMHEGWAILHAQRDELNEATDRMWAGVKSNDYDHAIDEARQVAAMAIRFIHDMRVLRAADGPGGV